MNDTLGHSEGDRVLIEAARRLDRALRPGDTVARLGGDEFVVLCEELEQESEALRLAERMHLELLAPFSLAGDDQYVMTASVGVALARRGELDAEALLQNADAAMYRAKGLGARATSSSTSRCGSGCSSACASKRTLRHAIDHDELRLHYQPIVSLDAGAMRGRGGVGSLAATPIAGLIPPGEFIPLAEESGLILRYRPVGAGEACRQTARWRAEPGTGRTAARQRQPLRAPAGTDDAGGDDRPARSRTPGSNRVICGSRSPRRPCWRAPDEPAQTLATLRELACSVAPRRLRDRLLVAQLPAAVPGRRAQDRPLVHRRAG